MRLINGFQKVRVIDRIDSHYLNVTLYKPLNGNSYIELPTELRNSKKGLT